MKVIADTKIFCDTVNQFEGFQRIVFPRLAVGKYVRPQFDFLRLRLTGDPVDVFGSNINRFVKNGERFKFGNCCERGPQVCFVALRISRGNRYEDIEAFVFGFLQGGKPLRRRWCLRLIDFGEVVSEGRQAHSKQEAISKTLKQVKIPFSERAARQDADSKS